MGNVAVEVTGNTIPKEYADLGVVSGYDPCTAEDARIFLIGPSGQGKSTWAASADNSIVLDFERGANALPGSRAARKSLKGDYDGYVRLTNKLIEDGKLGRRRWKRVVFDTFDELVEMVADKLADEKGVDDIMEFGSKGHGVQLIRTRIWSVVRELESAGYTWTIIGHLTEKTVTNPVTKREESVPRPLLFDTLAKKVQRNSDLFVSLYCIQEEKRSAPKYTMVDGRKIEIPGELEFKPVYYLYTQSSGTIESKRRGVPTLKTRLEMPLVGGWDVFSKAYTEAVNVEKQKIQQQFEKGTAV